VHAAGAFAALAAVVAAAETITAKKTRDKIMVRSTQRIDDANSPIFEQ
jgi:hypothetical protein